MQNELDDESPFHANLRTVAGLCVVVVVGAVASASGVGGGAIFIPLLNALVGFNLKSSTSLSQACITCGAAASLVVNLMRPHPRDPRTCLVDFSLAAVLTPVLLMGVGVGVILNVMLPSWLLTALLLLLLTALIAQSVHKGQALWLQENLQRQRHRQQQHHRHHHHVPHQHDHPHEHQSQPQPHVHPPAERQFEPRAAHKAASEPAAMPGLLTTGPPSGGASEPHLAIDVPTSTARACSSLVPPLSRSSSSPRLFSSPTTAVATITTTSEGNVDEDLAGSVELLDARSDHQQQQAVVGTLAAAKAKAPGRTAADLECGHRQLAVPYTTAGSLSGAREAYATSEAPAGSPAARSASWIAAASSLLSSLAAAAAPDSWQAFNELGAVEDPADVLALAEGGVDGDESDHGSTSGTSPSSRGSEGGKEREVDVVAMAVAGGDTGGWERELSGEVEPSFAAGLLVSGEEEGAVAGRDTPWHLGPDMDSTYMPIRASVSGGGAVPDGALAGCQFSPQRDRVTVAGVEGAAGAPGSPMLAASSPARGGSLLATPDRREGHRPHQRQPTSPTVRRSLDERTAAGAWRSGDNIIGGARGGDIEGRPNEVFVGLRAPSTLSTAVYGTVSDSQPPALLTRGASAGRLWSRPRYPAEDAACLMEPLLPLGTAGDAGPEVNAYANIAGGGLAAVAPCQPASKLAVWLRKGRGVGRIVAGRAAAAAAPATRACSSRGIPTGAIAALAVAWGVHFSLQVLRNQVPRCSAPWWALAAAQAVTMAALGAAGLVITAAGVAAAAATAKVEAGVDASKAAAAGAPPPRPLSPPVPPEAAAVPAAARAASEQPLGGQAALGAKGDAGIAPADDFSRLAVAAAAPCSLRSDGSGPAPAPGLSSEPPGGSSHGGGGGGCLAVVLRCPVAVMSATCSAGLAGGLLGLGGGMVMGPLLLHLGELPQVTAATSGAMVLFSSSAALTQLALLGRLNLPYAAVFGAASAAASVVGSQLLGRAVRASGRPSLVVLALAGVMAVGCGCVAVFGVQAALADMRGGGGWWPEAFAALCGGR